VPEVSSTVRQRELGIRLRELRNSQGLTVEEVAERLLCSDSKIGRAETGARRPCLRDVRDLCELYHVGQEESVQLMELARDARSASWWTQYDDSRFFQLIGLEQVATAITCFCMYFVPALLQTEEYAAAMIKGIAPRIDPGILNQRVAARMRRQELLQQSRPPRCRVLLDEAVLHRQVGDAAVMKAQFDKILQLVEEGKATVQVIPYGAGAYSAADSNFTLLEFSESSLPGVVYVEGLGTQLYLERPNELARYAESIEDLRNAALTPRDTTKFIAKICDEELGHH
jgi:transcriptional regulator with XRE-family HTH domain